MRTGCLNKEMNHEKRVGGEQIWRGGLGASCIQTEQADLEALHNDRRKDGMFYVLKSKVPAWLSWKPNHCRDDLIADKDGREASYAH